MKLAIGAPERLERMRENLQRYAGAFLMPLAPHGRSIALCGYGPSLARTWQGAAKCDDLMTCSGAHDFMIGRGMPPKYHVECDPREHKVAFVRNHQPGVKYCIASHCHPAMFEALRDRDVVMWHGYTDDDWENQGRLVAQFRGEGLIAGGTNVGMRALIVALALGYRHLELHGIDCSYEGDRIWAGAHSGERHRMVKIEANGRVFNTSDVMMQATDDFFNLLGALKGCKLVIHGDGLLEERVKIYRKDPQLALSKGWWKPVDFALRAA